MLGWCVQAFWGVEVEPSCEEEAESAGEGQHIGDGDKHKTAGAQNALDFLQDCKGVEAVFKEFNKNSGGENVVFEGKWMLNIGTDSGFGGFPETAYVNVKADNGMIDAGESVSESAFRGAGVQNEARRRKTPGQQPQDCFMRCRVGIALYWTVLQVPLFCSASRRRKSGSTSCPFKPIVFI